MYVAKLESAYYLFMGLWSILSLKSFEAVTGHKTDKWLVKTVGWLFVVTSLQLWKSDKKSESYILGIGVPIVIGATDVYYGLVKRRISRVYLLDVVPQAFFVASWLARRLSR